VPSLTLYGLRRFRTQLRPLADLAAADDAMPGLPAALAGVGHTGREQSAA
jgi:hypothetical protein